MKIPYFLPVRFDEDNETIDDAKGNVLYVCNWAGSGLEKIDVKERALHTVKLLNGEVSHKKTVEYFEAIAFSNGHVPVISKPVSDEISSKTANLPMKKKPGRPPKEGK